jgi:hypothetical protein
MVPWVDTYGVIGPLILDRNPDTGHMPLAFNSHDVTRIMSDQIRWDVLEQKKPIQVPYTHTNNFYDKRVLAQVPPPWYEAVTDEDGTNRGNHVDYDFLDKVKKVSQVWLHCGVVVNHLFQKGVTREDAKANKNRVLHGGL